jgi:hypothetical protein
VDEEGLSSGEGDAVRLRDVDRDRLEGEGLVQRRRTGDGDGRDSRSLGQAQVMRPDGHVVSAGRNED